MRELIDSGRYDTHDNFTVILQPFMRDIYLPRLEVRADHLETIKAFSSIHLFEFHPLYPSYLFVWKGWPAWSLVLFTWLFSSQPESSHSHGSWSLEQHGRMFLATSCFLQLYFFYFSYIIDFNNLLVRTSGQQDIYSRLWSCHWFEVSLWGNLTVSGKYTWHVAVFIMFVF